MGVISPVGQSLDQFWSALVAGRSGIGPLTIVPTEGLKTRIAAQVGDFDPSAHFDDKRLAQLDRFAQFAICAARSALRDASLELTEELAYQTATVVGSSAGGQTMRNPTIAYTGRLCRASTR